MANRTMKVLLWGESGLREAVWGHNLVSLSPLPPGYPPEPGPASLLTFIYATSLDELILAYDFTHLL